MRNMIVVIVGVAAAVAASGCSKSKSGTTGPSTTPAATITISSSTGASPKGVTVPQGSQVQFINNDNVSHNMTSDPHPEHNECPEINTAGFIPAHASRQTSNLNTARTCGFHDHDKPDDKSLWGSIVIQ